MRSRKRNFIRRVEAAAVTAAAAVMCMGATKGPDAGGYTATDAWVYSMADISGSNGGTSVLGGTDDGLAPLTLPFAFQFYGNPYTVVCASSNGALYFVPSVAACGGFSDFANVDLSTTETPHNFPSVLPFWSDLTFDVPGGGSVFYQTVGTPGSRRFIVQWNNAYPQGSPNPVTFQVVLSETTNRILFQYQTVALGDSNPATKGSLATIGIRNGGAPANQQQVAWSFDAPALADTSALLFSLPATSVVGDVNGDGVVSCADAAIVRSSFGKRLGQPGYDSRADLNNDRIVNVLDLAIVTRAIPAGTRCQ